MSDTNLSPSELADLKKTFVKAHGSIRWDTRKEVSQNALERLDDFEKKLNQHDGKIKDTYNIAVLGFIVLLITLAGIVVTVVLTYKDSIDNKTEAIEKFNNEKYEFLKERIILLENKVSTQSSR